MDFIQPIGPERDLDPVQRVERARDEQKKREQERKQEEEDRIRKLSAILEDNGMPTTGTGAMPPM